MIDNTFQTVTEANANSATRAVYEDIKSTMGVALVNLIWRHLAVEQTVLQWSWKNLKPHYKSGAIPAAAWLLRETIAPPSLRQFTRDEWAFLNQEIEDQSVLDSVLRTYERGNAQNLIAMCYLRQCIDGFDSDAHKSVLPELTVSQRNAERADRIKTEIPPLPDWKEVSDGIRKQIYDMSAVWVPAEYKGVSPSVFRHLAHWPVTLGLFRTRICNLQDDSSDRLALVSKQAIKQAIMCASRLGPATLNLQSTADQQWLSKALDLFINGMIARGVVIVPAMRAALVHADKNQ